MLDGYFGQVAIGKLLDGECSLWGAEAVLSVFGRSWRCGSP